jgi:hypothetical protein
MKRFLWRFWVQVLALMLLAARTEADITSFFDNAFSYQGNAPQGSAPWLSVSFSAAGSNKVLLNITALNLGSIGSPEFLSELDLNFNSNATYSVQDLHFAFQSGTSGGSSVLTSPLPGLGTDAYRADGDGLYDINFSFGNNTFGPGDHLTYLITTSGRSLDPSDFNYFSTSRGNNSGPFTAAGHLSGGVQGGGNGNFSAWIDANGGFVLVPEPASAAILLLFVGTWTGRNFRRKKPG